MFSFSFLFFFRDYFPFSPRVEAAFIFAFSPGHADMPPARFISPFSQFHAAVSATPPFLHAAV
jgi:hypothetical protein